MNRRIGQGVLIGIALLWGLSACQPWMGSNNHKPGTTVNANALRSGSKQSLFVPYTVHDGHKTVPIDTVAEKLGYLFVHFDEDSGVLKVGDTDLVLRLQHGSRVAEKAGGNVVLTDAPQTVQGHLHVPVSVLLDVFQEEIVIDVMEKGVRIVPSDAEVQKEKPLDDSFHFEEEVTAETSVPTLSKTGDVPAQPVSSALKDVDMELLLAKASSYLGVPYLFGAKPYEVSRRFDCSSFTRHVFGLQGVTLPRLAREQATFGVTVSRKKLQKGDLLFFYVPGRFKSNNIIGHVGIYIGNMQMIDANRSPKNGVQIRKINTPYWEKVFLKAKRVAV